MLGFIKKNANKILVGFGVFFVLNALANICFNQVAAAVCDFIFALSNFLIVYADNVNMTKGEATQLNG